LTSGNLVSLLHEPAVSFALGSKAAPERQPAPHCKEFGMAKTETFRIPLRVVFYKEDGDWIAHCLEFDLIGDGPTMSEAWECLSDAIAIQFQASVEHQNFENLFNPAGSKYFIRYARGRDTADGTLKVLIEKLRTATPQIDDVKAREYDESESESELACV
jgi:hypothetical protein